MEVGLVLPEVTALLGLCTPVVPLEAHNTLVK